jgi:hypothetical protein
MNVVGPGSDSRIYVNRLNGASWSGWGEVCCGGITPSAPDAAAFGGQLQVVVRGTDDRIYVNRFNGSSWTGWGAIPNSVSTPDDPAINAFGTALRVYTRGADNRIFRTLAAQQSPAPPPSPREPCLAARTEAMTALLPYPC